jgi:hypothetical protein
MCICRGIALIFLPSLRLRGRGVGGEGLEPILVAFKMMRRILLFCGLLLLLPTLTLAQTQETTPLTPDLVNLAHLRYLTEPVTVAGRDMALVHIYSETPDYTWKDAAGEGLSAVDDVARAAIVYLWEYERVRTQNVRQGEADLLDEAKRCLEFVLYMQADDGEFYNFVTDKTGTINRDGNTSTKSLGWWAMRGMWALGEGVRVFSKVDSVYADKLSAAYLRSETALGATLGNYGQMNKLHGYDIPAWIGEPDVTSIGLLGLSAYEQARPNATTEGILTKLAEGLAQYHLGDDSTYPWGMHPVQANAPGFYHTWGAHMTEALVAAGMVMHRQDWIDSAAADANSFMLRQLAFERFRQIGPIPDRLGQIAYGTNMIVQTYAALYHATGDEKYARYAGLAASWYFGNNMASAQMYFPDTGLVFDGINGPVSWRVNQNSGAESTIEGLMSMIAIANLNDPQATALLQAKSVGGNGTQILQAEDGERVIGTPIYYTGDWTGEGYISGGRYVSLGEGQRMRLSFDISAAQEDDYLLYIDHMHQASGGTADTIQRAARRPTLDGSDADWSPDIPALDSNTAQQFLRGAGLWKGADVDSHSIRLQWDDQALYVFADIRDPQLDQTHTLSGVGQGDALWLYFTNSLDASTISAKMTFAQTPDGAQVWDWKNVGFVKGAMLAFKAHADGAGYSFEAALPWSALDFKTPPQAGAQIGFEAGRGIGGDSFMDLTGRDPDVASNLLKLMLIAPGMDTSASTAPKVALEVQFANEKAVTLPESISPDSDFFWLDQVTDQPVHLTPGTYTIRYRYAGDSSSNLGKSKIDAFYLQPAIARRILQLPDGKTITLTYNTLTGEATWNES